MEDELKQLLERLEMDLVDYIERWRVTVVLPQDLLLIQEYIKKHS